MQKINYNKNITWSWTVLQLIWSIYQVIQRWLY